MKTRIILLLTCVLQLGALAHAAQVASYNHADMKRLMKTAQTADDFSYMAGYFDNQTMEYATKLQAEEKELDRLLALPYHARSYPVQVEGTRNRIAHLKNMIQSSSEHAANCRARADAMESSTAPESPSEQ